LTNRLLLIGVSTKMSVDQMVFEQTTWNPTVGHAKK
jgi:hypothetical protein